MRILCSSTMRLFLSIVAAHWQDHKIRELLSIRGEDEIWRQILGCECGAVIYGNIASLLKERVM